IRDIVVVGSSREVPDVVVGSSERVSRTGHVDGAYGGIGLAVHAGNRGDHGRVRQAVVDHRVGGDDNRRVGLFDRQVLSNVGRGKIVVVTGLVRRDRGAAVGDDVHVPHAGILIDAGIASGGEAYRFTRCRTGANRKIGVAVDLVRQRGKFD